MTQYPDSEDSSKTSNPPRPKEVISKEYIDTCAAYGDLKTRLNFMQADLSLIEERLIQLTNEAAEAATGDISETIQS